jgi:hypothetical protein
MKDWEDIQKIFKLYEAEYFMDLQPSFDEYKRAMTLVATRCFGHSLPSTMIVPLADAANHHYQSNTEWTLINKRLHVPAEVGKENKVYVYEHDFETDPEEKPLELPLPGSEQK